MASAEDSRDAPIVVVGAGPVGLTAALALAHLGQRVLVLEANAGLAYTSRAICVSRRSLELYDRIGVGEALLARGLRWTGGRSFYRDAEVFRLEMPHGVGDKHTPFVNLQQNLTESILLDAVVASPLVEVRWSSPVRGVVASGDGARLTVGGGDGVDSTIPADWIVACDGARSAIRQGMGLSLRGTTYEARYLIADIALRSDHPTERRVWFDPPSNPGSTLIMHRQPDDVWRIDYQLGPGEDSAEAMKTEAIVPRIQSHLDMIGERQPWRLVWHSVYRAHCLSLDSYRHGRVLFAGDAAHLVPIFGVRGLNSGIDDAFNLAWKLAAVRNGRGGDALLDSYSHERRGATAENHASAEKSTWFMSPPSAGFAFMRDVALGLAVDHRFVRGLIDPRQSSAHVYVGSVLNTPDETIGGDIVVGAPVPNLPLSREGRSVFLYDALPRWFCLLSLAGHERVAAVARDLGGDVSALAIEEPEFAGRFAPGIVAVLVRPDGHVAALFERIDGDEIRRSLDRALARRG